MFFAEGAEFGAEFGVVIGEDGDGEEGGVDSAGAANGEGANGDAAGHHDDGIERVEALEGVGFNRDAEDGDQSLGGDHAGEVGRAAGAGNDDLNAALFGLAGVGVHEFGRAVGADDPAFMGDAEEAEHVVGMAHGFPIGLGAHDYGYAGRCGGHVLGVNLQRTIAGCARIEGFLCLNCDAIR